MIFKFRSIIIEHGWLKIRSVSKQRANISGLNQFLSGHRIQSTLPSLNTIVSLCVIGKFVDTLNTEFEPANDRPERLFRLNRNYMADNAVSPRRYAHDATASVWRWRHDGDADGDADADGCAGLTTGNGNCGYGERSVNHCIWYHHCRQRPRAVVGL